MPLTNPPATRMSSTTIADPATERNSREGERPKLRTA
jgi:hypothetical protein